MPNIENIPESFIFHHIGCATNSLDKEEKVFYSLGYKKIGNDFIDPIQGVKGCFLQGNGPQIELLENLKNSETLTPWLDAGIKFYHFAYLVDDMQNALAWVKSCRARIVVSPVPAVAFDNNLISFAMLRNGILVEFIEKPRGDNYDKGKF